MENLIMLVVENLNKVGMGAILFLLAYVANMGLGAWRSVKIDGYDFDWKLILGSVVKYLVLAASMGALCVVITLVPAYVTYVGLAIPDEYVDVISNLVIIGAFISGTCVYIKDGIDKVRDIIK